MNEAIDFSAFPPERETHLKSIYRYSMFDVMYYRSNLWQHGRRVSWIVEMLEPLCVGMNIDFEKARVLALVHDDAEMVTGDIQAGHKAKLNSKELNAIEDQEEQAAHQLSQQYPKTVHGYNYLELLVHAIHKDCIEAQLVSYADRFDAYGETWHEMYAGNFPLIWSLLLYERWTASFSQKYPALMPLLSQDSPWVIRNAQQQPRKIFAADYQLLGTPHTAASIRIPTQFPYYNVWRAMVLENGGEEGQCFLTEQKEGLK